MKKGRFLLVLMLAVLLASPIAGLVMGIGLWLFQEGGGSHSGAYLLLLTIAFSYFIGLIPSMIVAGYVGFLVVKKRIFYFRRVYLVTVVCGFLAASPFLLNLPNNDVFYLGAGLFLSISIAFIALYYLVKKLLPWAGTSIIEPIKAGTP